MLEIEYKCKLSKEDCFNLETRLKKLGYNMPSEKNGNIETNIYLKNDKQTIRIRIHEQDKELEIVRKVKCDIKSRFKCKMEYPLPSIPSKELDGVIKFFEALGFKQYFKYSRVRSGLPIDNCLVLMDRIDNGETYLEIEAASDELIEATIKKLGLDINAHINEGYHKILKK